MKVPIIITGLAFAVILASCNSGPVKEVEEEKADTNNIQTDFCYSAVIDRDSVLLNLNITDSMVTGGLIYKFHEKDGNKGSITGKMMGDTLLADYKFYSEGMESMREVIFLKKDSVMIQGAGPMIEKGGRMVFEDIKQVHFDTGIVLKNYDCE